MKNITNIEKTAIAKITAKITTTALLFFLALFTFTTCLIAQETQTKTQKRHKTWALNAKTAKAPVELLL